MIDFAKLERPSSENRERDEKARRDREITEDHARRTQRARTLITITCTEAAQHYFAYSGARYLSIHGIQPDGRPVTATWFVPDHVTDEEIATALSLATRGTSIELRGYWKPHKNHDGKTRFTFMAQFIEPASRTEARHLTASPQDQIDAFG